MIRQYGRNYAFVCDCCEQEFDWPEWLDREWFEEHRHEPHLCQACDRADTEPAPPPDFADLSADDGRRPHGPHGESHEGPSTRAAE